MNAALIHHVIYTAPAIGRIPSQVRWKQTPGATALHENGPKDANAIAECAYSSSPGTADAT